MKKNYETLFVLTPVLSENQMQSTVEKIKELFQQNDVKIVNEENWGLRKLAYPIEHKKTGFYHFFEFEADPSFIKKLETTQKRDEAVMRFLIISLDKHAVAYNVRRKNGEFVKKKEETTLA